MNKDQVVPGIPEDFQIEAPVRVSRQGLERLRMPPLPKPILAHILRDRVAPVEMELAAYQQGRRDFLEELILMDKYASSINQVRAFLNIRKRIVQRHVRSVGLGTGSKVGGSLRQVDARFRPADGLGGLECRVGDEQRLGVGVTDVL